MRWGLAIAMLAGCSGGRVVPAVEKIPDAGVDAMVTPVVTATPAPAWTPAALAPVLWLDVDRGLSLVDCGDSQCVASWQDQSGNDNDASAATVDAQPLFATGRYNGHGALAFDGNQTSLVLRDAPSLQLAGGKFTILAVASQLPTPAPHIGEVYGKSQLPAPYSGAILMTNYDNWGYTPAQGAASGQVDIDQFAPAPTVALADGKARVYTVIFDGAQLSTRIDNDSAGAKPATIAAGALAAAGEDAVIGGRAGFGQTFFGDIVEIILLPTAISDDDWRSAFAYFGAKYRL